MFRYKDGRKPGPSSVVFFKLRKKKTTSLTVLFPALTYNKMRLSVAVAVLARMGIAQVWQDELVLANLFLVILIGLCHLTLPDLPSPYI